jgi:hypothetical protein
MELTYEQAGELLDHLDRLDRMRNILKGAAPKDDSSDGAFLVGLQCILSIHRAEAGRLLAGHPLSEEWQSILSIWGSLTPRLLWELAIRFPGVETGDEEQHYGLAHTLWCLLGEQDNLFRAAGVQHL